MKQLLSFVRSMLMVLAVLILSSGAGLYAQESPSALPKSHEINKPDNDAVKLRLRKKKVHMCQECGKPEPQCECPGHQICEECGKPEAQCECHEPIVCTGCGKPEPQCECQAHQDSETNQQGKTMATENTGLIQRLKQMWNNH